MSSGIGCRVEAHAERGGMRSEQADRRGKLAAGFAPAEFGIDDVALQAVRRAEMYADLGDAVQFVFWHILRHPVAAVVGEVQLLGFRMPVEADGVADAARDHFGARTIEIHAMDQAVLVVMQHVIAGLADRNVELVVGTDADELPAMGLVLRSLSKITSASRIVDDNPRPFPSWRSSKFADVERAVLRRGRSAGRDQRPKTLTSRLPSSLTMA